MVCTRIGASVLVKKQGDGNIGIIMRNETEAQKCPHASQIRLLALNHHASKGPMYARSLMRKLLGNENFCLQIDTHSTLSPDWDVGLLQEWRMTNNEFGVLSTIPADRSQSFKGNPGAVPRQCSISFQSNGVPNYESAPDVYVQDHSRPLLSHAWSAAFSFSKCHLEETVPYDPFSLYAIPVEQFVRFARMWTRGYDTYTPTKNYVSHDYGQPNNGHGDLEWFKLFSKNQLRTMAIDRAKLILELSSLSEEPDSINADRANLGLYGLGQRRSLEQMTGFINFQLDPQSKGTFEKGPACVEGHAMARYDATISPLANRYHEGATKLDPYPIFPLRTEPVFSSQHVTSAEVAKHLPDRLDTDHLEIAVGENLRAKVVEKDSSKFHKLAAKLHHDPLAAVGPELLEQSNLPPTSVLLVLWIFGLVIWYFVFAVQHHASAPSSTGDEKNWLSKTKAKASSGGTRRKTKIVKDV